ncbi:hypothetical protein CHELA40_13751 [Chelatococcus asaccharovorans]|nr:hypothetical protein CHELA40_13751 [Chelatococcus asaccharovorans]CAH1675884.1 hypothetical protein CHELA17_61875 [Chelatococcus asaccharovorans]
MMFILVPLIIGADRAKPEPDPHI